MPWNTNNVEFEIDEDDNVIMTFDDMPDNFNDPHPDVSDWGPGVEALDALKYDGNNGYNFYMSENYVKPDHLEYMDRLELLYELVDILDANPILYDNGEWYSIAFAVLEERKRLFFYLYDSSKTFYKGNIPENLNKDEFFKVFYSAMDKVKSKYPGGLIPELAAEMYSAGYKAGRESKEEE